MTETSRIDDRQEKQKSQIIEQLKKTPVIKTVCDHFGVGRTTFYRWMDEDEKFRIGVEASMVEGKLNVNDVSVHQLLALIHSRDRSAIKYWLENHHPDFMKNKKKQDDVDTSPSVIILHGDED